MFTLKELIEASQGEILSKGEEIFTSASIDTRTIERSQMFFPLKGTKSDGHDFVEDALLKSAGAVTSKELSIDFHGNTVVKVRDTLRALQNLARYLREKFKGQVIAVIGSNGKTTTKELIASFLVQKFKTLRTEGNLNNNIGVPLSISKIEKDTEKMVLELGTNRRGDIRELCEIALPDFALITNIGYEHIEGFGSLEGVREGELEILPYVHTVFVNGDDQFLMEGLKDFKGKIITFGLSKESDFYAKEIFFERSFTEVTISTGLREFKLRSPLTGLYNVYNLIGALSVAFYFGVNEDLISRALKKFTPIKLRTEVVRLRNFEIILDAYNANPSSMRAALEELVRRKEGRKTVAVLGDMLELGEYETEAHENLGKWLKELQIDLFIGVGNSVKNALRYYDGLQFSEPSLAAEYLLKEIKEPSVVLIKGSRAMRMERVYEILKERLG